MLYRRELCNLSNPEEGDLLVKIAGLSLMPSGPPRTIKISDETQKGREKIAELIKEGWEIISIKD